MKKILFILTLMTFALTLLSGTSHSQDVDLSGTWVGKTEVPEQGTNEVTLKLQKNNGEYFGIVADSLGMVQDEECENIEFKEGELTFHFLIFNGTEYMRVYVALTVEGDKMSGYWETEDGTSGSIELEKVGNQ